MSSAEDGVAPAVGMGGNSVVSLVQQLKAGKLTKEELFDQLSRIQKAKRGGPADSLPPGGAPHPPGEDGFQSPNAGASTDSGRAMPDNREAYRSGSGSQVAARADPGAERRQREEEELIRRAKLQYGASKQQSPERATHFPMSGNGFASGPEQEDSFDYEGAASQSAAGGARRDVRQYSTPQKSVRTVSARPQSADSAALRRKGPRASSPGQARRAASPRPSSPGPWKGGAGSARKAQEFEFATAKRGLDDRALERMRQIEQERQANYTFRPQLYRGAGPDYISSRTAASASGKGSDLYERSLAWQRRRDQQREEEKLRLEREREKECTFQPKVTREGAVQLHAALGYVHHAPSSSLHTRARPESPAARRAGVDPEATTERLYKQGLQHKKHLQEKLRQRLQEEMQQMCTFKPAVNPEGRVRDPTPVRARYMEATSRKNESAVDSVIAQEERDLLECTFKPAVRAPSKDMHVAREYLSEPAWLRLSRPRPVTPQASNDSLATSQGRGTSPAADRGAGGVGGQRRAPSPSPRAGSVKRNNSCDSSERFDAFLERQENFVRRMEFNLERRLMEQETQKRGPELCKRSKQIIKSKEREEGKVPFLERVEMSLQRKPNVCAKVVSEVEEALTFKPKINKASQALRGRSCAELSNGDLLHRSAVLASAKRNAETSSAQLYTFKPKLNHIPGVQSRLKVASDPGNYIARIEHELRMSQRMQIRSANEMLANELQECTFNPQINDAPAYVKKIATSQRRKKAAEQLAARRDASLENVPPSWDSSVSVPGSQRKGTFYSGI